MFVKQHRDQQLIGVETKLDKKFFLEQNIVFAIANICGVGPIFSGLIYVDVTGRLN